MRRKGLFVLMSAVVLAVSACSGNGESGALSTEAVTEAATTAPTDGAEPSSEQETEEDAGTDQEEETV